MSFVPVRLVKAAVANLALAIIVLALTWATPETLDQKKLSDLREKVVTIFDYLDQPRTRLGKQGERLGAEGGKAPSGVEAAAADNKKGDGKGSAIDKAKTHMPKLAPMPPSTRAPAGAPVKSPAKHGRGRGSSVPVRKSQAGTAESHNQSRARSASVMSKDATEFNEGVTGHLLRSDYDDSRSLDRDEARKEEADASLPFSSGPQQYDMAQGDEEDPLDFEGSTT